MDAQAIARMIVEYEKLYNSPDKSDKYNGHRILDFREIYKTIKVKIEEDKDFLLKNKPIAKWIEKKKTKIDGNESEFDKIERLKFELLSNLEEVRAKMNSKVEGEGEGEAVAVLPQDPGCAPNCTVSGGKTKNKRGKKKTQRKRTNKKTRRNRKRR